MLEEALEIADEEIVPSAAPGGVGWNYKLIWNGRVHYMLGLLRFYTGRLEDAETHLRQAIDPVAPWTDDFPQVVWLSWHLGWWRHDLAEVLTGMGRLEEAEEARRHSLEAWESADEAVIAA